MTDPVLELSTTLLSVEPGGQASTKITIRNIGSIVEGFRLEMLGSEIVGWAAITPAEVQIYPEQESSAIVVFAPPATGVRSGSFAFGVRAESVVDPNSASVVEGDIEVGRVFGLQSSMTPVTSSGRWRGRHVLALTNWGNSPVRLKVWATDPDERLGFFVHPEILEIPIGGSATSGVQVRTRAPFLRGTQVRLAFQVRAEPDPAEVAPGGGMPALPNPRLTAVDGAFLQRPILSRLVVVLATVLVLGIAAGLYFALTGQKKQPAADLGVGAPQTPTLTASPLDSQSAQLNWQAQPNLESYKVFTLTALGKTSGVSTIDGALDTYAVTELLPASQTCFQLQAIRAGLSSLLSDVVCVQTPAAPPSPQSSDSSATSAGSISETAAASVVSDPDPTSAEALPPLTSEAAPNAGESGAGGPVVVPPVGGVDATTGAVPVSATAATTAPTTATNVGPDIAAPAGIFSANQYIDVVWSSPVTDALAAQRAETRKQELIAVGIPALVLNSTAYPDLELFEGAGPLAQASFLVYVGPFDARGPAETYCVSRPELSGYCLPARPSPRG